MNPPKYIAIKYINFLIATQKLYSCSEASLVQPETETWLAHDTVTAFYYGSFLLDKIVEARSE